MAFSRDGFSRSSYGTNDNVPVIYLYTSSDAIATITASGYFNDAPALGGKDIIFVTASDATRILVTSLSGTTINTSVFDDGSVADNSITTAMLQDDSVTMEKAAFPVVVYNSTYTTTGGSTTETITGTFTASDSKVQVTPYAVGATPVTLKTAVVNDGNITLTFSADPSTDHKFNVTVFKG